MSIVVCESTQSCLEPKSISLKLSPPKPNLVSGWDNIESLSSPQNETTNKLAEYIHPLVKRSALILSEKSLEMCTENLGSETGSDIIEDDDIFSNVVYSESSSARRKPLQRMEARRVRFESLPPPLTILQGGNSVSVHPRRENGRLVMMAVSTSPRRSSMCVERCDGRLTMSLVEEDQVDEAVEDEEGGVEQEEEGDMDCKSLEVGGEIGKIMEVGGKICKTVEVGGKICKIVEVGGKVGRGEIQRLSRCNESGRGSRRLINLETFWVAT